MSINEIAEANVGLPPSIRPAETPPITQTEKLYPLDQAEFEVAVVTPQGTLYHKLRKPTLGELIEREERSSYETESVNDSEERVSADDEAANVRLWNQIVVDVKGYRMRGEKASASIEWRGESLHDLSNDLKAAIPAAHKSVAVRGLYQFTCEVEKDEGEGFLLGAETWTVKQVFGNLDFPDYIIRHILRTPTEQERREFKRKSSDVRFSKGSRKMKTKVVTHLKAHVELYDALLTQFDGLTLDGQTWETFTAKDFAQTGAMVRAIDPIWKRNVIDALMKTFEASVSD
jgi:hypothetical protein